MAADFQNVYRFNVCLSSSVVLVDVSGHNCNPAGENELSFVVGPFTCCPLHRQLQKRERTGKEYGRFPFV